MKVSLGSLNIEIQDATTRINDKEISNPFTKAAVNLLSTIYFIIICALIAITLPVWIPLNMMLFLIRRNGFISFPKENEKRILQFNVDNAFKKR